MQHPVGYEIEGGRAVMVDFFALVTNPNVFYQFTHVLSAGVSLAGFVVLGFSAYRLLKQNKKELEFFTRSFRWAATYALIGSILVAIIGHFQGQFLVQHQPLKMAAAEALWETEEPAGFALVAGIDEQGESNSFELKIPAMLSFLSFNNFTGKVQGINELQAEAVQQFGPGDYVPPVALIFWAFRLMVGAGSLMVLLALLAVIWSRGGQLEKKTIFLKILMFAPALPFLASTMGWVMAETGRWPWIVYRLQMVENAISPNGFFADRHGCSV
jgi:cytochrome d ubiquinol oxidase subunit I